MAIQLGARHLHGFDKPVDLLGDCHRRIEQFLDVLVAVCDAGAGRLPAPLADNERRGLEAALAYFRTAAPRHTADEEHSLFPRMRQAGDPRVAPVLAELDGLEADHRTADVAHAEVDALGKRWLADGRLSPADLTRLSELLQSLRELYRRHIEVEDTRVFPLARQVLSPGAVAEVGREMAERRGLSPPPGADVTSSRPGSAPAP
ncbi:MAG: hemerythrin domain-containing protein [Phycisphaerae bacterium]